MNASSGYYQDLAERALEHFDDVVEHWLPDAKYEGVEYVAINPTRADGDFGSFKINSETGAWADFALDEEIAGGDLIGLIAYLENSSQSAAAKRLEAFLNDPDSVTPEIVDEDDRSSDSSAATPSSVAYSKQPENGQRKRKRKSDYEGTLVTPVPNDAPEPGFSHSKYGQPSQVWSYTDQDGGFLCYIARYDTSDGGKQILPLTLWLDENNEYVWRYKALPEPRPVYGLATLASNPTAPVLITEGEKAADAAVHLLPGWPVVTTPGGSKAVGKVDLQPLAGRQVHIWPDNDDAGARYAEKLTQALWQLDPCPDVYVMRPLTERPTFDDNGQPILATGEAKAKGWDAADAVEDGWTSEHIELLDDLWIEPTPVEESDSDAIPDGYRLEDGNVYYDEPKHDRKGNFLGTQTHWLASYVRVVAHSRDANGENWGTKVEIVDRDNRTKTWCFPNELLQAPGSPYRSILASLGVRLATEPAQQRRFAYYLVNAEPSARVLSVEQPGWHRDLFVSPLGIFGASDNELAFQTSNPQRDNVFASSGTLADWREQVALPGRDNSRVIFALCAAFVGPMLKLLGAENGGFHFRGPSSTGKSTLLRVASSVWGGESFMGSWRATDNGLEGVASLRNDTLLTLDELQEIDPRLAGEAAYMLANGVGKSRSTRTGAARSAARWRILFLSSGEISLESHMASVNQRIRAGQQVRLVDLPADAGAGLGIFDWVPEGVSSADLSLSLKTAAENTYGVAGPAWLECLTCPDTRPKIIELVREIQDRFLNHCLTAEATGQAKRVCGRFALVGAVGVAAARFGVLPYAEDEVFNAVVQCYEAYAAETEEDDEAQIEDSQIIAQVRGQIERFGLSCFPEVSNNNGIGLELNQPQGQRTPYRAGYRKSSEDGFNVEYYVFPVAFRRDLCQGYSPRQVCQVLYEAGYLRPGSDSYARSERIPGVGKNKRVYVLTSDLMNDGDATHSETDESNESLIETQGTIDPRSQNYEV